MSERKGLTPEEDAWIKKLNRLLAKCPSDRLGFYTVGDPTIGVYDTRYEQAIEDLMNSSNSDFGPTVDKVGARLGSIKFPGNVASTAG